MPWRCGQRPALRLAALAGDDEQQPQVAGVGGEHEAGQRGVRRSERHAVQVEPRLGREPAAAQPLEAAAVHLRLARRSSAACGSGARSRVGARRRRRRVRAGGARGGRAAARRRGGLAARRRAASAAAAARDAAARRSPRPAPRAAAPRATGAGVGPCGGGVRRRCRSAASSGCPSVMSRVKVQTSVCCLISFGAPSTMRPSGIADHRGQLADEAHGDVGLVARRVEARVGRAGPRGCRRRRPRRCSPWRGAASIAAANGSNTSGARYWRSARGRRSRRP